MNLILRHAAVSPSLGRRNGDNKSGFHISTQVTRTGRLSAGSKSGSIERVQALFLAHFAANQFAGIIVILDDVDVTALLRVALRDLPVPVQGPYAHARVSDHAGPSGRSR